LRETARNFRLAKIARVVCAEEKSVGCVCASELKIGAAVEEFRRDCETRGAHFGIDFLADRRQCAARCGSEQLIER